eukprot:ANDGO_01335.mRNA.1 putative serine/threonine-protein kinase roco5
MTSGMKSSGIGDKEFCSFKSELQNLARNPESPNHLDSVFQCIQQNPSIAKHVDKENHSALFYAITSLRGSTRGRVRKRVLEWLIDAGAEIDGRAVEAALLRDQIDTIEYLAYRATAPGIMEEAVKNVEQKRTQKQQVDRGFWGPRVQTNSPSRQQQSCEVGSVSPAAPVSTPHRSGNGGPAAPSPRTPASTYLSSPHSSGGSSSPSSPGTPSIANEEQSKNVQDAIKRGQKLKEYERSVEYQMHQRLQQQLLDQVQNHLEKNLADVQELNKINHQSGRAAREIRRAAEEFVTNFQTTASEAAAALNGLAEEAGSDLRQQLSADLQEMQANLLDTGADIQLQVEEKGNEMIQKMERLVHDFEQLKTRSAATHEGSSQAVPFVSLERLCFPGKSIKDMESGVWTALGKGGSGVVYLAPWNSPVDGTSCKMQDRFVAIKKCASDKEAKAELSKAHAVIGVPSAVKVQGIVDCAPYSMLVMELMGLFSKPTLDATPRGPIVTNLLQLRCVWEASFGLGFPIPWKWRLTWLVEIAAALREFSTHRICHRDVKSVNVLVRECPFSHNNGWVAAWIESVENGVLPANSDLDASIPHDCPIEAKIADFELILDQKTQYLAPALCSVGTSEYMAPETFLDTESTDRADVYAFSMIMYELLHGFSDAPCPWHDVGSSRDEKHRLVKELVLKGLRPRIVATASAGDAIFEPYKSLMEQCWSQIPAFRPTFGDVHRELLSLCSKAS